VTNRVLLVSYLFGLGSTAAVCWLLYRWMRRNPMWLDRVLADVLAQLHSRLKVDDHWSDRAIDGRERPPPESPKR